MSEEYSRVLLSDNDATRSTPVYVYLPVYRSSSATADERDVVYVGELAPDNSDKKPI